MTVESMNREYLVVHCPCRGVHGILEKDKSHGKDYFLLRNIEHIIMRRLLWTLILRPSVR